MARSRTRRFLGISGVAAAAVMAFGAYSAVGGGAHPSQAGTASARALSGTNLVAATDQLSANTFLISINGVQAEYIKKVGGVRGCRASVVTMQGAGTRKIPGASSGASPCEMTVVRSPAGSPLFDDWINAGFGRAADPYRHVSISTLDSTGHVVKNFSLYGARVTKVTGSTFTSGDASPRASLVTIQFHHMKVG